MTTRPYALVLFGATGFTGGLTAHYLARHLPPGTPWALAGRNRAKLEQVAAGLPGDADTPALLEADSADPRALAELAAATRALATTVGPYMRHGEPLVRACVEQGTHYCDLTGEPEFVNTLIPRYHEAAQKAGCAIVNCCGFDSIPHDAGALFTVRELARAHGGRLTAPVSVEGAVSFSASFSGGTWQSALEAFARPRQNQQRLRDARVRLKQWYPRPVGTLSPRPHKDAPLGGWLAPMPTIDPLVVLRSASALEDYGPAFRYGHYLVTPSLAKLVGGAAGVGGLVLAAQIGPLRRRLMKSRPSGAGPDPETRARSWFQVRFRGRCGDTEVRCRVAGGDPGYDETAKMLSETLMGLALDPGAPDHTGVVTPVMALGDRLIERLQAAGMVFEREA
ncbi:MAG: saccharopine dehydrogenase NADP-binding domain-containing protein [Alcanivorax sp.]|uniref:Saccharopine dehydrogenase NADP-binding domain-containing protein n=1 Tax=Alloalcanivorax marinus TaxID=1177169 RepID=A0A9Q3YP57_9GAMM|nr:saccharopine dehydrogenase NADP-binding domain-containing protein [Alloalcanivorax marinus]MCC4308490.1 saccharopine dehydrogenase NADP-binding domain-containing protein [Alloalcanivorax marinus]